MLSKCRRWWWSERSGGRVTQSDPVGEEDECVQIFSPRRAWMITCTVWQGAKKKTKRHIDAAFTCSGKDDPFHLWTGNYECVVLKCFCCGSEMKHGGPRDPDLLPGWNNFRLPNSSATETRGFIKTQTVNNMLYVLSIFFFFCVALHHVEKFKGYLISSARVSKYSTSSPVEIRREGVFKCNFHVGFWYLP